MSKALVSLFVKIDEAAAEKQLEFLKSDKIKTLTDLTTELTTKIPEQEAAGESHCVSTPCNWFN